MKQSINFCQFVDAFNAIRPNNFTYDGLRALYDHIEDWENDTGDELELDVIAFCCEFSEYDSIETLADDWGIPVDEIRRDYLIIETGSSIIIQE